MIMVMFVRVIVVALKDNSDDDVVEDFVVAVVVEDYAANGEVFVAADSDIAVDDGVVTRPLIRSMLVFAKIVVLDLAKELI